MNDYYNIIQFKSLFDAVVNNIENNFKEKESTTDGRRRRNRLYVCILGVMKRQENIKVANNPIESITILP